MLKLLNVVALCVAFFVMIADESDVDWGLVGLILLGAVSVHLVIDAVVAFRRLRRSRRFADLSEYGSHYLYRVEDLAPVLPDSPEERGKTLPIRVFGTLVDGESRPAPLSGKPSPVWVVEAELVGGIPRTPGDGTPIVAASWWGEPEVDDGTGRVGVAEGAFLDPGRITERFAGFKDIASRWPSLTQALMDTLGLDKAQLAKSRWYLKESAFFPDDEVVVYGMCRRRGQTLVLAGNGVAEDPGSSLVRAFNRPASERPDRLRARSIATVVLALLAVAVSALLIGGTLLEDKRHGSVEVTLDGRAWNVVVDGSDWSFETGDARTDVELQIDGVAPRPGADAVVRLEALEGSGGELRPEDAAYPAWDGQAWVWAITPGLTPGDAPGPQTASLPADANNTGSVWMRNMSDQRLTLRFLDAAGKVRADWRWIFDAGNGAADPFGIRLTKGGDDFPVQGTERLEITLDSGLRRVRPVAALAVWKDGAWRLDLVPEVVPGEGALWVRNASDRRLQIWILGQDGVHLHGESPWVFKSREGVGENRGLALTVSDERITFRGRETLRYQLLEARTVREGRLGDVAVWKDGVWRLDMHTVTQP